MTLCVATTDSGDAGCLIYGAERLVLPRPIPDTPLGNWVATLDTAMTGGCT